ncbi:hypothetical protein GWK47_046760 [Chionoecetes opilio]|uniref:Uncharacterized protein n=1 Tax=Chionoecetes opilio TaxID=41210 RepID=A0A8J4Y4E2_CHIOP|nr:hypothetical protein GWK47_046760 [Chionoecetes opilio]
MGLHNLEEELALFLVFGQPEVEGLEATPCSAVSLTTRSPSIRRQASTYDSSSCHFRGLADRKSVMISRASKRQREFFVAKEGSVAAGTCDDGRFIRLAGSSALLVENGLYNCLFVGDGGKPSCPDQPSNPASPSPAGKKEFLVFRNGHQSEGVGVGDVQKDPEMEEPVFLSSSSALFKQSPNGGWDQDIYQTTKCSMRNLLAEYTQWLQNKEFKSEIARLWPPLETTAESEWR